MSGFGPLYATDGRDPVVVDQILTFANARKIEGPNEYPGPGTSPGTA